MGGRGAVHLARAQAAGRRAGRRPPPWAARGGAALALALAAAGAFLWADDGPPDPVETVFADDFAAGTKGWTGTPGGTSEPSGLPAPPAPSGAVSSSGAAGPPGAAGRGLRLTAGAAAPDRLALAPLTAAPPVTALLNVRMRVHEAGSGGRAGLSCRSGPGGRNGYDLFVEGDGRAVIAKVAGGVQVSRLAVAGQAPRRRLDEPGRAVDLEAVCLTEPRRTLLTLWVDGRRVADAVDGGAPFPVTAVGVMAGREPEGGTPTRVDFHDFRLSRF
ncbi:hypothetical protein HS041_24280 [Planomonospora sp. ID67723]|uniref:hypothetical protein n=1 Tax=Planomonospora sp. ID67723 TaxID=2738134 RepID=UPI0018C4398D|nr:hypothetical protein [Planomonospora sp. ID67723]MBG0830882.1 hypothetical protein [Planomonospora sp. ID67723]